jgi:putative transcriptional regulator
MKTMNKSDRVAHELLETARALGKHELLSVQELNQVITLCTKPPLYTPEKVVRIRTTKAKMSQAAFAEFLNVTASTVQKWESSSSGKHPGGAAAKLLQLIDLKGIEAITV